MTDPIDLKQSAAMVRSIPGSAFKVLVALVFLGGINVGNKQLKDFTGLSYPTIQTAMENHLVFWGLVARSSARTNAWQLTPEGAALLAMPISSQKLFDSVPSITINKTLDSKKDIESNTTRASEKNLDSPTLTKAQNKVLALLHSMGIFDPKAEALARLDHVTLAFVKPYESHIFWEQLDIPLAIWKIEHGQPVKEFFPKKCPGCNSSAYHGNIHHMTFDPEGCRFDEKKT